MSRLDKVLAAQATLDQFRGKAFQFGRRDCVRMAASHLRRLGYKVKLPPTDSYRSARSALKALRARGFADLAAAVDAHGPRRIAPAAAIAGDLLLIPGEGPFGGALQIALGNGRTAGYHQDAKGVEVLQPVEFVAAWRV
ncbi:DUF6950 family protein [Rhizorhabdus histidinilytica]|uniref:DUF6950 family protein n=1 Tax=Rhizorhabdus histidinilytica TaxID=439228 RepID=UPI0032205F15